MIRTPTPWITEELKAKINHKSISCQRFSKCKLCQKDFDNIYNFTSETSEIIFKEYIRNIFNYIRILLSISHKSKDSEISVKTYRSTLKTYSTVEEKFQLYHLF